MRGVLQALDAHADDEGIFRGHLQQLISGRQKFGMAEPGQVLQLHIEAGRVAQFADRRGIQRVNNGVFDGGKSAKSAGNHRLHGVFSAFAVAPIFEPAEGERRVLSTAIEAETGDGDETLDFGLLQKIFLDLFQHRIRSFLGRADGQLDIGDKITLILGRQE